MKKKTLRLNFYFTSTIYTHLLVIHAYILIWFLFLFNWNETQLTICNMHTSNSSKPHQHLMMRRSKKEENILALRFIIWLCMQLQNLLTRDLKVRIFHIQFVTIITHKKALSFFLPFVLCCTENDLISYEFCMKLYVKI